MPQPLEIIFDFFSRPSNLQKLTPTFLDFRITEAPGELTANSLIPYQLRIHGFPVRWTTQIVDWQPPHGFIDVQLSGPYKLWRHQHTFIASGGGTLIGDSVSYALPFGLLGELVHRLFVRGDVEQIFNFREKKMRELFGE